MYIYIPFLPYQSFKVYKKANIYYHYILAFLYTLKYQNIFIKNRFYKIKFIRIIYNI